MRQRGERRSRYLLRVAQPDREGALVDIAEGEEITCNYFEFDPRFTGLFGAGRAASTEARPNGNGSSKKR